MHVLLIILQIQKYYMVKHVGLNQELAYVGPFVQHS
jgi:hypothetical protein